MGILLCWLSFKSSSWGALIAHTEARLLMKVGFHVYLMPWFAEFCLNVNGNEDWHVENRLCHSSPPWGVTVRAWKRAPFLSFCPCICHYKLTTSLSWPCLFLNAVCVFRWCTWFNKRSLWTQHIAVLKETRAPAVLFCSQSLAASLLLLCCAFSCLFSCVSQSTGNTFQLCLFNGRWSFFGKNCR